MRKIINKTIAPLRNNNGSIYPFVISLIIVFFFALATLFEIRRLKLITITVSESVRTATYDVITENSVNTFTGFREGYAGAYQYEYGEWEEKTYTGKVKKTLAEILSGVETADKIIYNGPSGVEFEISSISTRIENTAFKSTDNKFRASTTYKLKIPLHSMFSALPPLEILTTENTQWNTKY